MDINTTKEQLDRYFYGDELIQNVFPNLKASEREFIKNGITAEESKKYLGLEEEWSDSIPNPE